jgi:hypothetical protein
MAKHDNWPEYCTLLGCTNPSERPHHHHMVRGHLSVFHCTCGNIDEPGTKPKEPKVVKK